MYNWQSKLIFILINIDTKAHKSLNKSEHKKEVKELN
ncbi:MAG: hypothetical protein ACI8RY_000165, partial [Urechidicola sp.]